MIILATGKSASPDGSIRSLLFAAMVMSTLLNFSVGLGAVRLMIIII